VFSPISPLPTCSVEKNRRTSPAGFRLGKSWQMKHMKRLQNKKKKKRKNRERRKEKFRKARR
jgi:hypothetical protein